MKLGKRVLFLSENSRKLEKGVLFGRLLPHSSVGIFIFLYFLYFLVPSLHAKVCSSDGIDVEVIFVISYRQASIRFKKKVLQ